MADHRQGYTPIQLLYVGMRFVGDWDAEAAAEAYMRLHPEADLAAVWKELNDFMSPKAE